MLHAPLLKGFIIFLVVAGVIVPLFHRARVGTVLGFLLAGVALGPYGLGRLAADHPWLHFATFDDPRHGEPLAEFGIMILLFLLGLELSLERLWQLRRYVLGVGLAQVLFSTLAIGLTVRFAGGVPPAGIVLGLCLALSSTAIVMQLLIEQHRAADAVGRIALSVLLFQDMMVVPILFIIGLLVGGAQGGIMILLLPFGQALVAVFVIMLLGSFIVRPLLRSALRTGSRDLIMAIALLIVVVCAVATGIAGLSIALGAFLAGLLLSGSEARHQIEVDLEPFKGLLLGIFFITVGASLDVMATAGDGGWIVLAVVALVAVKSAILFVVARAFGVNRATAIEVSLLLGPAGEFAFVVLAQATTLLSPRLASDSVAVVALSMMVTPLLALLGRRAAAWLAQADHSDLRPGDALEDLENHVVIGGCGRIGHLIANALAKENVPFVGLDTNGAAVAAMRKAGHVAYYGDASRVELLERVGGGRARAFAVTVNNPRAAERMVAAARQVRGEAAIFARAADHVHAARLVQCGAIGVIPEAVEASLQLAARLMEGLDLPDDVIAKRIAGMRADELARLDQAEIGMQ